MEVDTKSQRKRPQGSLNKAYYSKGKNLVNFNSVNLHKVNISKIKFGTLNHKFSSSRLYQRRDKTHIHLQYNKITQS